MTLSDDDLAAMVADANQAPSVHNTQPTRWRRLKDGRMLVLEDPERRLPVGDPEGRDAAVSHGAAIEGFALACAARGLSVSVSHPVDADEARLRPVALLTLEDGARPDDLHRCAPSRRTYRGPFVGHLETTALQPLRAAPDVKVAEGPKALSRIAALNDEASFRTFQNGPFRAELLSWMRLSRRHPRWGLDGLNAEAMAMSPIEAAGAGVVLRPGVFEAIDALGAARFLVAERKVVRSAQAVVLFHRPEAEAPLATGRRFYRLWLEFERIGLSAAPMAVLADDETTRRDLSAAFDLPPGRRLITAFRIGQAPLRAYGPKPRLPASTRRS
jgi:nitroreductase